MAANIQHGTALQTGDRPRDVICGRHCCDNARVKAIESLYLPVALNTLLVLSCNVSPREDVRLRDEARSRGAELWPHAGEENL